MATHDQTLRLGGMRGAIAAKMTKSLQTTAQLTFHADCDATDLITVRQQLNAAGGRYGVEDLVIFALARALAAHPGLNGHVTDESIELRQAVNVAVAIALPDGLMAPCVFDVQQMDLAAIAAARADLVERTRSGKLKVSEMTGGTITISNLGQSRVAFFTPILNLPQIAILGIGRVREQLTMVGSGGAVRAMMGLSLTVDHRAVDGAPAAAFLSTLCEAIEGVAEHVAT